MVRTIVERKILYNTKTHSKCLRILALTTVMYLNFFMTARWKPEVFIAKQRTHNNNNPSLTAPRFEGAFITSVHKQYCVDKLHTYYTVHKQNWNKTIPKRCREQVKKAISDESDHHGVLPAPGRVTLQWNKRQMVKATIRNFTWAC